MINSEQVKEIQIERVRDPDDVAVPTDDIITIISMHDKLKPRVICPNVDAFNEAVSLLDRFQVGVIAVNLRSMTQSTGRISWQILSGDPIGVCNRNGVVFATLPKVLAKFPDNPEHSYKDYVRSFMRRYVAYLNDDFFVVKEIVNSSVVSVSEVCYGKRQARDVARQIDDTVEPTWFY